MADTSGQTARELKRKDAELERRYVQSLRESEKLEQRLDLEGSLWRTDENNSLLQRTSQFQLMHKLKSLGDIITDPDKLRPSTGLTYKMFKFILDRFEWHLELDKNAPLFRDAKKRATDPGNRCKLYPRHVLLMALMRKRCNAPQGILEAVSGVDQSTVCRYLQVTDRAFENILPTAKKMTDVISTLMRSRERRDELANLIGGKIMLVDGTHTPIKRPGDNDERREVYSGKKKAFTYNTAIVTNKAGIVLWMGPTHAGSTHDLTAIREDKPPFEKWGRAISDELSKVKIYADLGYLGIANDHPLLTFVLPQKTRKNAKKPTKVQKTYNKRVAHTRVLVEHAFGRIKQYDRMTKPYEGTQEEFNAEMNVVTGLANLKMMFGEITNGRTLLARTLEKIKTSR